MSDTGSQVHICQSLSSFKRGPSKISKQFKNRLFPPTFLCWMLRSNGSETGRVGTAAANVPLSNFSLTHSCSRTISMETGFQNVQLCSTILNVTFPPEVIGPLFFFPLLYMIFQLAEGILFIIIFRCYEKTKPPEGEYCYIGPELPGFSREPG